MYTLILVLTLLQPNPNGTAQKVVTDLPRHFSSMEECHAVRDRWLSDPNAVDAQCVYRFGT